MKNKKMPLMISVVVIVVAILIISIFLLKKENEINEYNGLKDLSNIKQTITPNKEYYLFEDNNKKYIFFITSVSCYSPDEIQIKAINIKSKKYTKDNKLILDVDIKTEITEGKLAEGLIIDGYNEDSRDIFIEVKEDCQGLIINGIEYSAYDGGIIHNPQSNKYGYVDNTGTIVFPIEYNKIEYFNEDYLLIENTNGEKGLANKFGKFLIECKYASISNYENNAFKVLKSQIRATTIQYNKIGIVDINGNLIKGLFEIKNNSLINEYYVYRENNKYGVIDKNLNIIVQAKYYDILLEQSKNKEYYLIISNDDNKRAIMDLKENILIPFQDNISLKKLSEEYEKLYKEN